MAISPFSIPKWKRPELARPKWSSINPGALPPPTEPKEQQPRLSKREQMALRAQEAEAVVTLEVRGLDKLRSGQYKLPYRKDQPLRIYLHEAGLMMTGARCAMYDVGNYSKGRLKTSYTPLPNASILLCPAPYSPILTDFQAKKVDATRVAANSKVEEVSMTYGRKAPPKKLENPDGVDQW